MDIEKRISEIEREINIFKTKSIPRLEDELFELKKKLQFLNGMDSQLLSTDQVEPSIISEDISMNIPPSIKIEDEPIIINNIPKQETYIKPKPKQEILDFENKLGQNLMGIIASILIFIGLSFFVVLIYEYLTDLIKIIGMYSISSIILALGLFLYNKKRSIFALSLMGCGIGSLYISVLVTNVYFHYINDISMYSLILVWLIGIVYLSNRFKNSFITSNTISIIGQIGIFIAILLGTAKFETTTELILIVAFMFATSMIYLYISIGERKEILKNILILSISTSSAIISSAILSKYGYYNSGVTIKPTLLIAIGIAIILYNLIINYTYYKNNNSNEILKAFVIGISSCFIFKIIGDFYNAIYFINGSGGLDISHYYYLVVGLIIFVISEINKQKNISRIVTFVIFNLTIINSLEVMNDLIGIIGISFIFIPMMLIGFIKNDNIYKNAGFLYLFINALIYIGNYILLNKACGLLQYSMIVSIIFWSLWKMFSDPELYKVVYKLLSYVIVMIATVMVIFIFEIDYKAELIVTIISIIGILAYSSAFAVDWRRINRFNRNNIESEKSSEIVLSVINYIIMFFGFIMIYLTYSEVWHFIIIAALAGLCFVGSYKILLKYKDTKWVGFYLGIKTTIFANLVLYSYDLLLDNSYFISIISLAIAVIAILLGFKLIVKSLRVYGLILSMLSIFKLLLIDIQYDNSMGRVISFIIAGLLCFGINFVYSVANKKTIGRTNDVVEEISEEEMPPQA